MAHPFVCFSVCASSEIMWNIWNSISDIHIIWPALPVCLLCRLDSWIVPLSNVLCASWPSTTLHTVFSMPSSSMLGIPNNAEPSPNTMKTLHPTILSLCTNFTVHTPNCSIFDWLCIYDTIKLFLMPCNASIIDFGNNVIENFKWH